MAGPHYVYSLIYDVPTFFFAGPDDCSFESESQFPCHWYNITRYSLRWIRYSGSTPSYDTGPTGDATVGFDGSKWAIDQ